MLYTTRKTFHALNPSVVWVQAMIVQSLFKLIQKCEPFPFPIPTPTNPVLLKHYHSESHESIITDFWRSVAHPNLAPMVLQFDMTQNVSFFLMICILRMISRDHFVPMVAPFMENSRNLLQDPLSHVFPRILQDGMRLDPASPRSGSNIHCFNVKVQPTTYTPPYLDDPIPL
jgi:hypothetical protein